MFFYQAYGLNIYSYFFFTELPQGEIKKDVYIQKEKEKLKPPPLETTSIQRQGIEALFGGNKQEAYLRWPGVATLLAKDGNTLIVDPDSNNIDPQLLNLYILSEALGLILYQRGFFLLHASAVQIGEKAIIFAGPPGAGKSTTAAAFAKYGYTVLADDMVAITFNNSGKAMVIPAFPQIKIWPSSVEGLGYNLSTLPALFGGSQKRVIRQKDNFSVEILPLSDIFFLEEGDLKFTTMEGTNAFFSLARFFPLPSALLQEEALERHFQQCIQLLSQVDIWKLENPKDFQSIKDLVNEVEGRLQTTQSHYQVFA